MSRNFELLEEIERELNTAPANNGSDPERRFAREIPLSLQSPPAADEEIAKLVQNVFLPICGMAHHEVVFCGIERANGSSSVCARAGRTLAAISLEKICLVDANPHSPGLSCLFGVSREHYDEGNCASNHHYVQVARNLWLTTLHTITSSGTAVSAIEMRSKLADLRRDFAYVLIDAPGCSSNTGATFLGRLSDTAILVIEAEETRRVTARKAKQDFEAAGIRLLGTVLHNRSFPIPKTLYERL